MDNTFIKYGHTMYNPFPIGDYRYNVWEAISRASNLVKGSKPIVNSSLATLGYNPNAENIDINSLDDTVGFDTKVVKGNSNTRRPTNMYAIGYGAPLTYEASLDDKEIMPVMIGRDKLGKTIYETVPTTESGNYYLDPVTGELTKTKITTDSEGNRWYRNKSVNRDVPLDTGLSLNTILRHYLGGN